MVEIINSGFVENIFGGLSWFLNILLFSLVAGVFIGIVFYILRSKKYSWIIRVFERDASDNIVQLEDDKGGIFLDKTTNNRLLLLKKHKFGLDPDEIPYIMNSRGKKITYLVKTGLKNYQFLKPNIVGEEKINFNVQDEDVAWAINAYQKYKLPNKNDLLKQILPIIGIAVFGVIVLGGIYMILQEFSVLSSVANALESATSNMKNINTGTTVIE